MAKNNLCQYSLSPKWQTKKYNIPRGTMDHGYISAAVYPASQFPEAGCTQLASQQLF